MGVWKSAAFVLKCAVLATSEVKDGHFGFRKMLGVFPHSASVAFFLYMGTFEINVGRDLLRMGVLGLS